MVHVKRFSFCAANKAFESVSLEHFQAAFLPSRILEFFGICSHLRVMINTAHAPKGIHPARRAI